ncbi:MAG: O-antigen ligase family protein [Propionibacteriaceae bacterium]|nr:O-antigen ligase family protein [Propionibacteriaceae bacterium]
MGRIRTDRQRDLSRTFDFVTISFFLLVLGGRFSLERLTGGAISLGISEIQFALIGLGMLAMHAFRGQPRKLSTQLIFPLPFFAWALASSLRGELTLQVAANTSEMLTLLLIVLMAIFLARLDPIRFASLFVQASAIAGIIFAIAGILLGEGSRISAFGGGPNVFGRVTGVGAVAALYLVLTNKPTRLLWIGALPIMVAATILSGSRGAMLGLSVGLVALVPMLRAVRVRPKGVGIAVLTTISLIGAAYLFRERLMPVIQLRVIDLTINERYTSGRDGITDIAIQLFKEKPIFGWGLFSFETQASATTGLTYPHNLVLQIAAELGLFGIVLFALILLQWLFSMKRSFESTLATIANSILLLYFTVSMFSGDYYDARQFFIFSVIVVAIRRSITNQGSSAPASSLMDPNWVPRATSTGQSGA